MIDWGRAENAKKLKVYLNDGTVFSGSGEGLNLAKDFDNPQDQYDTFFLGMKDGCLALKVDEIERVEILT